MKVSIENRKSMKMLKYPLCALMLTLAAGSAEAQVAMDLIFDYPSYLRDEQTHARVAIRNDTDRLLLVGGLRGAVTLEFRIMSNDRNIPRTSGGLMVENAIIMPGQVREVIVDLRSHFNIQPAGQYQVTASVAMGRQNFLSPRRVIDVVPGIELLSAKMAVPGYPARVRSYSLRYWNRKDRDELFLSASDEKEGMSCGVLHLGPLVRFMSPEITIDADGSIRTKHQCASDRIAYTALKSTINGVSFVGQETKRIEKPPLPRPGIPANPKSK